MVPGMNRRLRREQWRWRNETSNGGQVTCGGEVEMDNGSGGGGGGDGGGGGGGVGTGGA